MNKKVLNVLYTCMAFLLIPGLALAQHPDEENSSPWPESEINNYIAGCRFSFMSSAYADYLRRQGMSEQEIAAQPFDSLPPDQQEAAQAGFEKLLTVCDCIADILETEVPYEEAQQNPDALMYVQQEIMSSGECSPPSL